MGFLVGIQVTLRPSYPASHISCQVAPVGHTVILT